MKESANVLLVDDRDDDRLLAEYLLRGAGAGQKIQAPRDGVALGQLLAMVDGLDIAVIDADLSWCPASRIVADIRQKSPACAVIFYSVDGIGTLTPELATLNLQGFYSKSHGGLAALCGHVQALLSMAPEGAEQLSARLPAAGRVENTVLPETKPGAEATAAASPQDAGGLDAQTLATQRESNGFHSEMFFAISHDLRQPLQIFRRQTRLLQEKYRQQLEVGGRELVNDMARVAAHMELLLESILAYYRLDVSAAVEKARPLCDVVDNLLDVLQPRLTDIDATVELGELPDLRVPAGPFTQLLQNLLDNCIKFRGDVPLVVDISALEVADHWLITIRDNGVGFDNDHAGEIFNMFRRLHEGEKYPGAGMGLALCQKIVDRFGGRIWAQSEEGKGTSIHFTLPRHSTTLNGDHVRADADANSTPNKGTSGRG